MHSNEPLKIRRVLMSVSDKTAIVELARAFSRSGAEIVATGKTATVLVEAGLTVLPIEKLSGSPEAFRGRMKTLSFNVCGGILYRRGDAADEADLNRLKILPIDCVVVNFYPFEEASSRQGISREELIEEIDIGGPTLVRAASKNAPSVLVLTDPSQYAGVIGELSSGGVSTETAEKCAASAWDLVLGYDTAIAAKFGQRTQHMLRYGENPHQKGWIEVAPDSPIDWTMRLTQAELSYNNIMDFSAAYGLTGDLCALAPDCSGVVIVKHNNPCGVASVPKEVPDSQLRALELAWAGDPISAFGGIVVFTEPVAQSTARWLSERFVEGVAAPGIQGSASLEILSSRRKNLKAVTIRRFNPSPKECTVTVPGGKLFQTPDTGLDEELKPVTRAQWPSDKAKLAKFGIAVCRSLKSNTIVLVREIAGGLQLVGAGQGQPNRVDALRILAVPRAKGVLRASGGSIADCLMVSDAFFPFRDTVEAAHEAGIRWIIQPGGSMRDAESIAACDEFGIAMAFTGVRHFKH